MRKKLLILLAIVLTAVSMSAVVKVQGVPRPDIKSLPAVIKGGDASFSLDDIQNWTGEGSKRAAFVFQWNFDNEYVTETNALVFGYRFDGDDVSAADMIVDIVKNNPRLYMAYSPSGGYGAAINGIGYDANDDGYFFVYGPNEEIIEFDEYGLYTGNLGGDDLSEVDPTDYWRSGWFSGYWSLYDGDGPNNLEYSQTGVSGIILDDDTWVGFNFCTDMSTWTPPDFKPFVSAPSNQVEIPDISHITIMEMTDSNGNAIALDNNEVISVAYKDATGTSATVSNFYRTGDTGNISLIDWENKKVRLLNYSYIASTSGIMRSIVFLFDNSTINLPEGTFSQNSTNLSTLVNQANTTGNYIEGDIVYDDNDCVKFVFNNVGIATIVYRGNPPINGKIEAGQANCTLVLRGPAPEPSDPFAYIENWTGEGANKAAVTIQFNDDRETNAMTFGYRFDGETNGAEMLKAIVENNPRLYALMPRTYTAALYGLGWDANDNQYFGLDLNGTEQVFNKHIVYDSNNSDNMTSIDPNDLWQTGWMMNGFWAYFVKDDVEEEYEMSMVGYGDRIVKNGSWDAWYFDEDYSTFSDDPEWKEVVSAPEGIWRPLDLSGINSLTLSDTGNEEIEGIGTTATEITFNDSEQTEATITNFLKDGNNATATFDWKNGSVVIAPQAASNTDNSLIIIVDNSDSRFVSNNSYVLNSDEMAALQSATITANVRTRYIDGSANAIIKDESSNVKVEISASDIALLNATPNGDGSYNVSAADGQDKCSMIMTYKVPTAVETIFDDATNTEIVETVYYNSLGQRALRPYSGINIVVNRHADGTATTAKRIFR